MKEALSDFGREEIIAAWGEPTDALSGVFGEVFFPGQGKALTVYYSKDGRLCSTRRWGRLYRVHPKSVSAASSGNLYKSNRRIVCGSGMPGKTICR